MEIPAGAVVIREPVFRIGLVVRKWHEATMSVAPHPPTAETRILPLRCRADLKCREQQIGGSRFWHLKDPVTLRYFQLKPEEYAVLKMLDGTVSLHAIRQQFEEQFAPQRLSAPRHCIVG